MVSIIYRTEEDQTKIIDKDAKNKFKWSWLEKFVTVEIEKKSHKIMLADCIEIVLKQKNKARIVIKLMIYNQTIVKLLEIVAY